MTIHEAQTYVEISKFHGLHVVAVDALLALQYGIISLGHMSSGKIVKGGVGSLEPLAVARRAVDLAADKQAEDVVLLDTRKACSFTDYIVICSGETARQVDAIHREIEDSLKKEQVSAYHSEGDPDSGWILLDYSGVVVHIFSSELRGFYGLENVYDKAVRLLTVQ